MRLKSLDGALYLYDTRFNQKYWSSELHLTNIGSPEKVKKKNVMLMLETSTIGYNKYLKLLYIYIQYVKLLVELPFFFSFFRSTPFYIPNGFIWATTCANPEVSLHYVVLPFDYFYYYWSSDEFTFCRLPVRQFHGETVFY